MTPDKLAATHLTRAGLLALFYANMRENALLRVRTWKGAHDGH
jgi:hypothetical protein